MVTLCSNHCFHDLWLNIDRILNFFLTQIFTRGDYVIHEAIHCLSRKFPLVEGAIETANQSFQGVVHILVMNHRIGGIDRISAKVFRILTGKVWPGVGQVYDQTRISDFTGENSDVSIPPMRAFSTKVWKPLGKIWLAVSNTFNKAETF